MPIQAPEMKLYKSTVINDTTTNGGRLSSNQVVTGVKNNFYPNLSDAQRSAGVPHQYRKGGYKVDNDADTPGTNGRVFLRKISPGDTRVLLFQTTNILRDTQADIVGTERKYGIGELNADVSASGTTLVVNCEAGAGADLVFQAGDTIRISDGTNTEYATIDTGGVSWATDQATITLTAGLTNGYAAATPTVVSACIEQADVKTSFDNWVETSTSGTYDETTYPPTLDNIGGIEETWTLTFSDATNFSVSGDTVGSVGSGTTGGDFAPSNPDFSKPYFTLLAAGWAGTWANGETIVFQTHPAAIMFWADRITPAGSASGSDETDIGMYVESV